VTADSDDEFVFEAILKKLDQEKIVALLAEVEEVGVGVAGTRVHNALVRLRAAGRIRSRNVHEVVR